MGAVLNRDDTKMNKEIKKLTDEIKSNLVLITNSNGLQIYGIASADIELLSDLADERGAHDKYQDEVANRFNTKFKTAQTVQAKGESKRRDTLDLDEKRAAAEDLVDAMFTAKESDATKQKKAITSGADLVAQIDEAKAAGDDELASELQEQLNDMMRAFATK
jgi:hypothetical protein